MPVNECTSDGLPGVRWGEAGACYTYAPDDEESRKDAVRKALAQGIAIGDIDTERGLRSADIDASPAEIRSPDWMTPRQSAIYETIEQITEVYGAFDKTTGPDGVHYVSADDNPFKQDGLVCAACAFYKGGGECELLAEQDLVEAEGVCKFWIVPGDRPADDETDGPTNDGEEPEMLTPDQDEPMTERSHSPVPVEYRDSGAGAQYKTITGYAAVWNKMSEDLGGFREILAPGAFTRALERGNTIKLLYDHDSAAVLASTQNGTLELREDEVGLHIWARVDMSDPDVQRVAAKLRSGIVDQMSFAFSMDEDSEESWDYNGGIPIRTIRAVSSLWETSVVSMPAYTSTKVALLERAKKIGRLPELVGATVVAPHGVGEPSPIQSQDRDTDAMRAAYWRAQLTKRKQETSKWTPS